MIAASTLRFLLSSIAASLPPFAGGPLHFRATGDALQALGLTIRLEEVGDRSARWGNGSPHQASGGSEGAPSTAASSGAGGRS